MLDPQKRTSNKTESGTQSNFTLDHGTELFTDIGSTDFLNFSFNNKDYKKQIEDAIAKTGRFCAVTCTIRVIRVRPRAFGENLIT
jgi:acetyl-CoA carboxylase beta subunit